MGKFIELKNNVIEFLLPETTIRRKICQYVYRMITIKENRKDLISKIRELGICGGIKYSLKKVVIKSSREYQDERYKEWIEDNKLSIDEINKQKKLKFKHEPLISIITPLYNTPEKFFLDYINSIKNQTYSNWEVCLVDASEKKLEYIEDIIKNDSRIKYKAIKENKGISENSNEAMKLANGEYIALVDHDDIIEQNALFEMVNAINSNKDVDFLYSDEDKFEGDLSNRYFPFFKPDFSIDFFRSNNYICHFSVIKKCIIDEIGGFRRGFDGAQDYDLFLRVIEKTDKIIHIPKILYHWRVHKNSTSKNIESKMYAIDAGQKAIEEHCRRMKFENIQVEKEKILGFYRIKYDLKEKPLVSIIIPNKDSYKYLNKLIQSIFKSTYPNFEIIIVENNSNTKKIFKYYEKIKKNNKIKVIQYNGKDFNFSKINNFAINFASGEYIILLNNDTKVITKDWIEEMLSICQRDEVGIVGAKLLYKDKTVQHAGVVIGLGGVAGHVNRTISDKNPGYYGRANTINNYSAVTAACLMTKKELYKKVGGLDENLKVAFNDVDYCMKIRAMKKFVVYTPYAKLYHYESKSRGQEDTPEKKKRFNGEIELFKNKWKDEMERGDPYFNPNLDLYSEQCEIKSIK